MTDTNTPPNEPKKLSVPNIGAILAALLAASDGDGGCLCGQCGKEDAPRTPEETAARTLRNLLGPDAEKVQITPAVIERLKPFSDENGNFLPPHTVVESYDKETATLVINALVNGFVTLSFENVIRIVSDIVRALDAADKYSAAVEEFRNEALTRAYRVRDGVNKCAEWDAFVDGLDAEHQRVLAENKELRDENARLRNFHDTVTDAAFGALADDEPVSCCGGACGCGNGKDEN